MADKPILMTGWSVRRTLANQKTHTRGVSGLEQVNESWRAAILMMLERVVCLPAQGENER